MFSIKINKNNVKMQNKTIIFNKVKGFRLRKKDEKLPSFAIKPPNSKSNQKKTLKEINDQLSI